MPFGTVHNKIMTNMYDPHSFVCVIAPRKIGKTPLISFSYPMKQILYNMESYIVIVSETAKEAERRVGKIVRALESNERIHYYYGAFIDRKNRTTSSDSVQFVNGIWLRSKGALSQIRGTDGDWSPPSLIIVDDPQSNKNIKTQTSIMNAINWFEDEVIYSKAQKWKHVHFNYIGTGRIRFLGTSLHPMCLAEVLSKDPRFKSIRYEMLMNDKGELDIYNGRSIWEAMFPTADLHDERRLAEKADRLVNWMQERLNIPYRMSRRFFDVTNNRYWDVGTNRFELVNGVPCFIMDENVGLLDEFKIEALGAEVEDSDAEFSRIAGAIMPLAERKGATVETNEEEDTDV